MTRMSRMTKRGQRRGFSLVELLAVVLILAVLAGVAVPLYLNSRKNAAARTCKANIAAIAAAESAYATRFGSYKSGGTGDLGWEAAYVAGSANVAPTGGLLGAPEGLAQVPTCPLKGSHYTVKDNSGAIDIECPDAATHATDAGAAAASWKSSLQPSGNDKTNPL